MFWKTFRWSLIISAAAFVTAYFYGGLNALFLCFVLSLLEVSLSFDNAVLNATVLRRMSEFWQKMFLTVGIFIAVFGMRLLFPLLIVAIVAGLNPVEAVQLSLEKGDPHTPGTYGFILAEAHPQIAAFGGMFLLMLFLNFMLTDRKLKWLHWIEAPLAKIGRLNQVGVVIALTLLVIAAEFWAKDPNVVLVSGILGILTYVVINGLGALFEHGLKEKMDETDIPQKEKGHGHLHHDHEAEHKNDSKPAMAEATKKSGPSKLVRATGKAGFFLFLYLEVLDASFSFDGVIGAFAITSDPIIIALGLGLVGAMFVRSITIYLVKKGSLNEYVFLEHGAHWAIGALAVILIISIGTHVNELITGTIGILFISAAVFSSVMRKRKQQRSK
ncbi:MAG: DUF475 domain-containing protein [Candidatus Microsaccharimonas sp.]